MSLFSNGSEWENWSANWCGRCIRDRLSGQTEDECPLILDVMLGETPEEFYKNSARDYTSVLCTRFSPAPGETDILKEMTRKDT
jgi:hypothetical protein